MRSDAGSGAGGALAVAGPVVPPVGDAHRATRADWLTTPANKWAFRHTRELFSSARVAARSARPLEPATSVLAVEGVLGSYLQRSFTDALVVLHRGRLAGEWYAPRVAPDDRHILFSVTKSVVGLVASALIAEGVLDETASVSTYVPEVASGGYGTAVVRDLLDMTANIRFVEDYDGPDVRRYREASGQVPSPHSQGVHAFAAGLQAAGPHGAAFSYVSPSADVAGWVCERAAGLSLAQLVSTYVWAPMGGEYDADLLLDPHGAPRASGGLCATARDTARIGQLLLGEDLAGAVAAGVADVRAAGDRAAWAAGSLSDFLPGAAYRDLWYQPGGDPGVFLAAGIYGQRIYVDVPRRVVIAQQASLPGAYDDRTWTETLPAFARLACTVAGG
jgi:hypothetical protein